MSDNQEKIVASAASLFSRYGVKRTSMASVAEEAGLSRQTVYSLFPTKNELLAAAMTSVVDQIMVELENSWSNASSVEDIMNAYYKHAVYMPFEILQKSPDLKDLLHGVCDNTKKVATQSSIKKSDMLSEQLLNIQPRLKKDRAKADALAKFVVKATTEFKYSIDNRKELEGLLNTLSQAVVAMLK